MLKYSKGKVITLLALVVAIWVLFSFINCNASLLIPKMGGTVTVSYHGDSVEIKGDEKIYFEFIQTEDIKDIKVEYFTFTEGTATQEIKDRNRAFVRLPTSIKNLTVSTKVGDINVIDINVDNISVKTTIGNIKIINVSANSVKSETVLGNTYIGNVSAKTLQAHSIVNKIDVEDINIDDINIRSSAGNITLLRLKPLSNYSVDAKKGVGELIINGKKAKEMKTSTTTEKKLFVRSGTGDITISEV